MSHDEILEDPAGAPYPTTVQVWWNERRRATDPYDWDDERRDLVDVLESVAAVAREHPTPPDPDAPDTTPAIRLTLFSNGFASGISTYLQNLDHTPRDLATEIALAFTQRVFSDPILRQQMIDQLADVTVTDEPTETYFTSHPAHPHEGEQPT